MADVEPAPDQPRRGRPAPLRAEVVRTEQLSATMRRVVLGGADLDRFIWPGAASHLKLMLPLPGESAPALPVPGPDGTVRFDRSGMTMRTYTPRAWDPVASELTIDMFLHGDSPASTWALQAEPGDGVAISQPRASYEPDPGSPWLVLAGDETAVPAMATILERCTAVGGPAPSVVVEIAGGDTDLGLTPAAGAHFVPADTSRPGHALLEALAESLPEGDGRVWVAGEAKGIRSIRALLQRDRGLPAAATVTRGYWKLGAADHPDHDFGDG